MIVTRHKKHYSRDLSHLVIAPYDQDLGESYKVSEIKKINRSLTPNVKNTFAKKIKNYPYKKDNLYEVFHNISDVKNQVRL